MSNQRNADVSRIMLREAATFIPDYTFCLFQVVASDVHTAQTSAIVTVNPHIRRRACVTITNADANNHDLYKPQKQFEKSQ